MVKLRCIEIKVQILQVKSVYYLKKQQLAAQRYDYDSDSSVCVN